MKTYSILQIQYSCCQIKIYLSIIYLSKRLTVCLSKSLTKFSRPLWIVLAGMSEEVSPLPRLVELQQLIAKNTNENTKRSTNTWLRRYQKWAEERGFESNIVLVPKLELDAILQQFYAELIKSNGQEYEPESLKVMQSALDRHLREEGCSFSILKDPEFSNSRKVLNGKAIVLQENGKGKRPRKADALTENEEELL